MKGIALAVIGQVNDSDKLEVTGLNGDTGYEGRYCRFERSLAETAEMVR